MPDSSHGNPPRARKATGPAYSAAIEIHRKLLSTLKTGEVVTGLTGVHITYTRPCAGLKANPELTPRKSKRCFLTIISNCRQPRSFRSLNGSLPRLQCLRRPEGRSIGVYTKILNVRPKALLRLKNPTQKVV
jgi:hypothetical protein